MANLLVQKPLNQRLLYVKTINKFFIVERENPNIRNRDRKFRKEKKRRISRTEKPIKSIKNTNREIHAQIAQTLEAKTKLTCQPILAPPQRRKRKHLSATDQNSVQPTSQTTARITQQGRCPLEKNDESINRPIKNKNTKRKKRKRNRNLHSLFPSPLSIRLNRESRKRKDT